MHSPRPTTLFQKAHPPTSCLKLGLFFLSTFGTQNTFKKGVGSKNPLKRSKCFFRRRCVKPRGGGKNRPTHPPTPMGVPGRAEKKARRAPCKLAPWEEWCNDRFVLQRPRCSAVSKKGTRGAPGTSSSVYTMKLYWCFTPET